MHIVIVTGMSGSGKTLTLNTMEDQGYYCIDNIPLELLETLITTLLAKKHENIAIGLDVRGGIEDLKRFPDLITTLKKKCGSLEVIYLYADLEVLQKRYNETRRRHPLYHEEQTLAKAIELESHLLSKIIVTADYPINTSDKDIYQLSYLLKHRVCKNKTQGLSLMFQSFGFKHSPPTDSDFLFDIRCLPNPYWKKELRLLTGLDDDIKVWLESHEDVIQMRNDIAKFLQDWIPRFESNQKAYLTVSIGCTGGRHRSVYLTESLKSIFDQTHSLTTTTYHRELKHLFNT